VHDLISQADTPFSSTPTLKSSQQRDASPSPTDFPFPPTGVSTVLYSASGSGNFITPIFTTSHEWQYASTFKNCAQDERDKSEIHMYEKFNDQDYSIIKNKKVYYQTNAKGFYDSGESVGNDTMIANLQMIQNKSHYLDIQTACSWQITVQEFTYP
jgi:hypothetical protein